jgi:Mrp family chromosome partitioning ATPase
MESVLGALGECVTGDRGGVIKALHGLWPLDSGLSDDVRQHLACILVELLNDPASRREETSLWRTLSDVISGATTQRSRDACATMAATVIVVTRRSQSEMQRNAAMVKQMLPAWSISDIVTRTIAQQLDDMDARGYGVRRVKPEVISVFSQKGGVGKTTVALGAACHLADMDRRRVCVVELDFGGPSLHHYAGLTSSGPFVNEFVLAYRTSNERALTYERARDRGAIVRPLGDRGPWLWPADPGWEAQVMGTSALGPDVLERLNDAPMLEDLLDRLATDFDTVVFDTPAEFKDITRSVSTLLSRRGGAALLVGSLAAPSIAPLIENYWRLLSGSAARCALVLNRVRALDLERARSSVSLADYLITERGGHFVVFGTPLNAPVMVRRLAKGTGMGLPIVVVREVEDIQRAGQSEPFDTTAALLLGQDMSGLHDFLKGWERHDKA